MMGAFGTAALGTVELQNLGWIFGFQNWNGIKLEIGKSEEFYVRKVGKSCVFGSVRLNPKLFLEHYRGFSERFSLMYLRCGHASRREVLAKLEKLRPRLNECDGALD